MLRNFSKNSRHLFNASAVCEVLVGLGLIFAPALVIELLFGKGLSQTGIAAARVLGIALLSLGISAWEVASQQPAQAARFGIWTYNIGAAGLLTMFGARGEANGILLWPAAGLHWIIGLAMIATIAASFQKRPGR